MVFFMKMRRVISGTLNKLHIPAPGALIPSKVKTVSDELFTRNPTCDRVSGDSLTEVSWRENDVTPVESLHDEATRSQRTTLSTRGCRHLHRFRPVGIPQTKRCIEEPARSTSSWRNGGKRREGWTPFWVDRPKTFGARKRKRAQTAFPGVVAIPEPPPGPPSTRHPIRPYTPSPS